MPDVAAAHVGDDRAHRAGAQQAAHATQAATARTHRASRGSGRPGVAQPAGERIADDEDEHRGDGREGQQGGEGRAGDVETLPAAGPVVAGHPPAGPIEIV